MGVFTKRVTPLEDDTPDVENAAECLVTLGTPSLVAVRPFKLITLSRSIRPPSEPTILLKLDRSTKHLSFQKLMTYQGTNFFNWMMSMCIIDHQCENCPCLPPVLDGHVTRPLGKMQLTQRYFDYYHALVKQPLLYWPSLQLQSIILRGVALCRVTDISTSHQDGLVHDWKNRMIYTSSDEHAWCICTQQQMRTRVILGKLVEAIRNTEYFAELNARFERARNLEIVAPDFGFLPSDSASTLVTKDVIRQLFFHDSLYGIFIAGLLIALTNTDSL